MRTAISKKRLGIKTNDVIETEMNIKTVIVQVQNIKNCFAVLNWMLHGTVKE